MRVFFRCQIIVFIFLTIILSACDDGDHYAPVEEIATIQPIPRNGIHVVQKGESLYAIAWRYGKDYQQLANINHLQSPYYLHQGQLIHLRSTTTNPSNQPISHSVARLSESPNVSAPNYKASNWLWPAEGRVIKKYSDLNKGINIEGKFGAPIYSALAGQVVYSGNGLRGYGNLIIIKHNNQYLSAYAHNNSIYVKEGQWVKRGQAIASMGRTSKGEVMLHFEIRRAGTPIDPLSVLGRI